jgi:hypothetical protein
MRAYGYSVGKRWAAYNERDEGKPTRSDKRVRFCEARLFSYSTCVARYHKGEAGLYLLVTSHTYSVSTTSHVSSCVHFATAPTFHVPYVDHGHACDAENLDHLWKETLGFAEHAIRAWNPERSWHANYLAQHWASDLAALHRAAEDYIRMTGMTATLPMTLERLLDWVRVEREARSEKYHNPVAVAARERARVRRIAVKALHG